MNQQHLKILLTKEMFIILDSCGIFDMCATSNLAENLRFFEVSPFLNVFIANAMSFPFPKLLHIAEKEHTMGNDGRRTEVFAVYEGLQQAEHEI